MGLLDLFFPPQEEAGTSYWVEVSDGNSNRNSTLLRRDTIEEAKTTIASERANGNSLKSVHNSSGENVTGKFL